MELNPDDFKYPFEVVIDRGRRRIYSKEFIHLRLNEKIKTELFGIPIEKIKLPLLVNILKRNKIKKVLKNVLAVDIKEDSEWLSKLLSKGNIKIPEKYRFNLKLGKNIIVIKSDEDKYIAVVAERINDNLVI